MLNVSFDDFYPLKTSTERVLATNDFIMNFSPDCNIYYGNYMKLYINSYRYLLNNSFLYFNICHVYEFMFYIMLKSITLESHKLNFFQWLYMFVCQRDKGTDDKKVNVIKLTDITSKSHKFWEYLFASIILMKNFALFCC